MNNTNTSKLKINKSFVILIPLVFFAAYFFDEIIPIRFWIPFVLIVYLPDFLVYLKSKNKYVLSNFLVWGPFFIIYFDPWIKKLFGLFFYPVIIIFWLFGIMVNLKWKDKLTVNKYGHYFRNILKMAAKPVTDCRDGFTDRPYPVGKIEVSGKDIANFAEFLNYNLIAISITEHDKVILVLSNGWFQYIPFLNPNPEKVTWIAIYNDGNLSVHVAKKDYYKYKNEVTFDRLCSSLGNMFIEFFNIFRNGRGKDIIKIINNTAPENENIQSNYTEKILKEKINGL